MKGLAHTRPSFPSVATETCKIRWEGTPRGPVRPLHYGSCIYLRASLYVSHNILDISPFRLGTYFMFLMLHPRFKLPHIYCAFSLACCLGFRAVESSSKSRTIFLCNFVPQHRCKLLRPTGLTQRWPLWLFTPSVKKFANSLASIYTHSSNYKALQNVILVHFCKHPVDKMPI